MSWSEVFERYFFPVATLIGLWVIFQVVATLASNVAAIGAKLDEMAEQAEEDRSSKEWDKDDFDDDFGPDLSKSG